MYTKFSMHTRVQPYMYCCTKFSMCMPDATVASTKQYNVLPCTPVGRVYPAQDLTFIYELKEKSL